MLSVGGGEPVETWAIIEPSWRVCCHSNMPPSSDLPPGDEDIGVAPERYDEGINEFNVTSRVFTKTHSTEVDGVAWTPQGQAGRGGLSLS